MREISDEFMQQMLKTARPYSVMILSAGPNYRADGAEAIIWEHGRRNFEPRQSGQLAIICPITDDSERRGIGLYSTDVETTKELMADDPGVTAGVFVYDVHPALSFPGDALPS
jgi:hypothetical protein